MKNYRFIGVFLFCPGVLFAQVNDNFSTGNLSAWSGSTNQFIINATGQLQLNNSVAGASFISTPFAPVSINNFEWTIYVKQTFSPSASNYSRVYLCSDSSDLTGPLNGYYLQFGEAGSNDAIQLFRQTGLTSVSVCRGKNGGIAASFAVRIKILRDTFGSWQLWTDYSGGNHPELDATGTDLIYPNSAIFGVLCVYTSSNATKFFFDDIYAGPQRVDTIPPSVTGVTVISNNALELTFSEPVTAASAELPANFSVNNAIGNPQTASLQADNSTVMLVFAKSFANGIQNLLTISSVEDLSGNAMPLTQMSFLFFQSVPTRSKDVIITEIFPDPIPQIGLPTTEFIELYNRSPDPIDIKSWMLSDGVSTIGFPSQIILPKEYWIVTGSSSASQYAKFGNVIAMSDFPTLNNETDTLTLKTPAGLTIDSLNYSLSWYHDSNKQDGGWTLELIDPNNPCGEEDNWSASEDPSGGTPGKQNSIYADKPDRTGPKLLTGVPIQSDKIVVTFDKKLDPATASPESFVLYPLVPISKSSFTDRSLRKIELQLETPLSFRQQYALTAGGIRDCNGNDIQTAFNVVVFALPELADSLDIVINEILFNPRPNGSDFVEILNRSPKFINIKNWKVANMEDFVVKNIQSITSDDFILAPAGYLALTPDPDIQKTYYPQSVNGSFFQMVLPGMPDDSGSVALLNDQGKVMDYFIYDKSFHSDLIKDDEGVSLERISSSGPTNDPQNWKSASSQSGFATPGYVNSNARPLSPVQIGNITIDPEIFIPNNGSRDFAAIQYDFERSGFIANIRILDLQGHLIRVISNNETLGFNGFFRWDGDREDGSKARIGYYVVWAEIFDLDGNVKTFRKRVVIATR